MTRRELGRRLDRIKKREPNMEILPELVVVEHLALHAGLAFVRPDGSRESPPGILTRGETVCGIPGFFDRIADSMADVFCRDLERAGYTVMKGGERDK